MMSESARLSSVRPRVYLSNGASPWANGIYARAALATKDRKVDVAPWGTLRIEDAGTAPLPMANRVYRMTGLWMEPVYVVLAQGGGLLATFDEGRLVLREQLQPEAAALNGLQKTLAMARMRDLQNRLAHRFERPVRIANVHVFDARTGTVGPLQNVDVTGERITAISSLGVSAGGAVVIDGEGGTLVPGLRDMHSHTSLSSNLYNIAAGVTSTRDMGNDNEELLAMLPRIETGEIPGPRVTRNGFVEGVSPFSSSNGKLARTLPEALAHVRWYASHGYFQLKVYNSIPRDWVRPMAAEAHRLGMGVTGHVPAFATADDIIRDGYDEIAHTNQFMFGWVLRPNEDTRTTLRIIAQNRFADIDFSDAKVQRTFALMKEHRTVLDTTMCIQERLALSRAGRSQRGDLPFLDHAPIAYQRFRKRSLVPTSSPAEERAYEVAVDKMLQVIKRLYDQGNRLMPGTDDGYGFPIHRELELYVMAGIPAGQALRMATLGPAEYLRQADVVGTIQPGKLADMVLVPGDPTRDITIMRKGRMVIRGGLFYFPDEVYSEIGIKPFSRRPSIAH